MIDLEINAELAKINFILENVVASLHAERGGTADGIDALADDLLRQMDLPGTKHGSAANDTRDDEALNELAKHRLEMFFAGVKDRLKSAGR